MISDGIKFCSCPLRCGGQQEDLEILGMKGKPSKSQLKKKADKLWSRIIIAKAKGKCEVCGRKANQPHHIIGRKNLLLRHDLRNGACLCFTHHTGGNQSAHNDPIWFLNEWLAQTRGEDYNYLFERKERILDFVDYNAVIEGLKNDCPKDNKNT